MQIFTHLMDLHQNVMMCVSLSHNMEYDMVTGWQHVHLN